MDSLTLTGLVLLGVCAAALAAATTLGIRLELAPALAHRAVVRRLRADVQILADEHAARPAPRARHNAHCPACGRFARVTSSGPHGVRTRCSVHGVRLRAVKRIGRPERNLVGIITYAPLVALPGAAEPPPLHLEPPARALDWLDGESGTVTPLRLALPVAA